ncbi:MAG: DUF1667 domain-containing protein [Bacilli bacterium]|jgi:CxxC motif-containing protein
MKDVICIVCPNSCHLQVDETTMKVIGQQCPRGEAYGRQEITNPKRTLTTSVRTVFSDHPLVSVRTSGEIPKASIAQVMKELQKVIVDQRLPKGSVIVENVAMTGVDVITTASLDR